MTANAKTDAAPPVRKPRAASWIATVFGLGYVPKAPGTWGAAVGALLYFCALRLRAAHVSQFFIPIAAALLIALAGVWTSDRTAKFAGVEDPGFVIVDEVSGQFITYLVALAPLRWQYLLLGFILFRVFDIWKPFPIRQAESLPGGWGIMADDWLAGIYAALGLWIARVAGL